MTPESFQFLTGLVKARSGIVLTTEKAYMLETRLAPMLKRERLVSLDALAGRLRNAPSLPLATEVVEALTTNESSFFRDGKPFEHLRKILPALAASRPAGQALRVWSAASSTGQEAYSVAMIVNELGPVLGGRRVPMICRGGGPELPIHAESDFCITGYLDPDRLKPEGPFGDHLRYHLFRIVDNKALRAGLRQVIRSNRSDDEKTSRLLIAAGLARQEAGAVLPRCPLYASYFGEHLDG